MSQKTTLSTSKSGKYKIKLHPAVIQEDSALLNAKQKEKIKAKCITLLSTHPNEVGEPLRSHLSGYRKLKIFNDYRIVYKVDDNEVIVYIIAVGIRRDEEVYEIAKSRI
jgi:mRNA interferase RelE/StbE